MGLGVTTAALESMAGPCRYSRQPDGTCADPSSPRPTTTASVGVPVALGGVGIALLGAAIMATSDYRPGSAPTAAPAAPALPESPVAFEASDAVAMAVAHLVVSGINSGSKRPELLGFDDTQAHLLLEGPRAELWNLRVHTASTGQWLTFSACFEYETEWRLTSISTSPGCALPGTE